MTAFSAVTPETAKQVVFASRVRPRAEQDGAGGDSAERGFEPVPQVANVTGFHRFTRCEYRGGAETGNSADVLGPGPQRTLLPSPTPRGHNGHLGRRSDQRADAVRTADLVGRQGQEVDAELGDVERHAACGLNGVAMHGGAGLAGKGGDLRDGLNNAGLVVGKHDGDTADARRTGQARLQPGEIDDAVGIDRDRLDTIRRVAPPGKHRRVLHGGYEQHVVLTERRQRQGIGLGAAAREGHRGRRPADERGHDVARILYHPTRRTPRCVDRRGIASCSQRLAHGRNRLRPCRGGRVVVEIGPLGAHRRPSCCPRHRPVP